jgi:DNA-binding NarL/FixJ family response regulator
VPSSGPRVLLVDDALGFRAQLREVLADYGLVVAGEAGTGAEGVELACRLHPDVVLMDLRMPEMDGITATRVLAERLPSTPVIIVSAYDDPALTSEARRAGAYAYLVKGCPVREILAVVEQAAEEAESSRV